MCYNITTMSKHESGNHGSEEPVKRETKRAVYKSFENILDRFGYEDEVFITATVAVHDVLLTPVPEQSMPVVQVRKPSRGPGPAHNFDYEVIYGFGPSQTEAALHLVFLGDMNPVARGIKKGPLNPSEGGDSQEIEIGWPTWGLCESDAQHLLEDLRNIETSPGIGEQDGTSS